MRILITGGTGFLGMNLLASLSKEPSRHEITVLTRTPPKYLPCANSYVLADLLDKEETLKAVSKTKPEVIIHLAARVGGIGANRKYPADFMYENLEMGMNIINAARLCPHLKKFIMIGTVCSYPKHCPTPFREELIWNGYPEETNAGYGIAKKTLMELSMQMHNQYGFPAVNLIPVNLYGPGDNFNPETSHVIPALIKKIDDAMDGRKIFSISKHKNVEVWGDGSATREFLHVEDAVQAIIKAITIEDISPLPINIGSGYEISIRHLAECLAELMKFKGKFEWNAKEPNGQPRRKLNIEIAKIKLKWQPKITLEEGLKETIKYYHTIKNLI